MEARHEDINLLTLLVGATADGLQVMDHDGSWIEVEGNHDRIIVDSGDMLQNLTNGLFKSTTHRVVNPPDAATERYSMPMFVHPRGDVDLTPRQKFVEMTVEKHSIRPSSPTRTCTNGSWKRTGFLRWDGESAHRADIIAWKRDGHAFDEPMIRRFIEGCSTETWRQSRSVRGSWRARSTA